MTQLPLGWVWTTVGQLGDVTLGRQRAPKYHSGPNMRPYLRVKNVFEGRIDTSDVMEMNFAPEEYERYKLEPGDILLNEGQSPELVGRPAMYRDEVPGACFTNSLIRFRSGPAIDPFFALYLFRHYLHSGRFQREARITTNIAHLSAGRFSSIEVALPPLAEQRRIVSAVDEQLGHIESGTALLNTCQRRIARLYTATLRRAVDQESEGARWMTVADAGLAHDQTALTGPFGASLGREDFCSAGVPVITIGSLQDAGIDSARLQYISQAKAAELERYSLIRGDLLFSRMASVGRVGLVDDSLTGAVFNYHIIRLRLDPGIIDPEYFVVWARGSQVVRDYLRSVNRGATRDGINTGLLLRLPVLVPALAEQRAIVERVRSAIATLRALETSVEICRRRALAARTSILRAAFRGELVRQDPDDEPAGVLLEQIAATVAKSNRTRRRREKTAA